MKIKRPIATRRTPTPRSPSAPPTPAPPSPLVLICGDLVWDTHIARLTDVSPVYYQPHGESHLKNRHGGAWYLKDLVGHALEAEGMVALLLAPEPVDHAEIEENKGNSLGVAKGFSVWEWFEGGEQPARVQIKCKDHNEIRTVKWKHGEPCPGAWRIKEFLGCQQPDWQDHDHRKGPQLAEYPGKPDLLLVDDLGLGFGRNERFWPACLRDGTTPVLVKAAPGFERPLWRELLRKEASRRVTVVLAASALRDAGANLSCSLSWDRTIEEIKTEFKPGGVLWPLRGCYRVIVFFGNSGAAVFSRIPLAPGKPPAFARFERFVFDPQHTEESWAAGMPGSTFGIASALTASVAVHSILKAATCQEPSSHVAVSRGLAAARILHRVGGGVCARDFDPFAADKRLFRCEPDQLPEQLFVSAFPRELLDLPVLAPVKELPPLERQTLLTDALGVTREFLTVAAEQIVRFGHKQVLRSVPRMIAGDYLTVDREEIERLNAVRNLIQDYRNNAADKRPLSLAVFGPPGSGKSFAIKQLSASLFGKDQAVLEFNLSQFEDSHGLHEAFHDVRDQSVQGKLPLVFWDEFDCMRDNLPLGWLREFLAPMQDAVFLASGRSHPFGKCIFIFAGGTCPTFGHFNRSHAGPAPDDDFKKVKGPDFVSRLRGYVNIKGPNPVADAGDEVHIIRRALMLRSHIERHHQRLIRSAKDEFCIDPYVLDAFLRVGDGREGAGYLHGARSMESIVSLIRPRGGRFVGPSELPADELLNVHVAPDFMLKVRDKTRYHTTPEDIETLAAIKHDMWREAKAGKGCVWGPKRDENSTPPTHPLLVDFAKLEPKDQESNLLPARLVALRLAAFGIRICPEGAPGGKGVTGVDDAILKKLAISEHRRWMRQRLLDGFAWTPGKSDDRLLLHADIRRFANLAPNEQYLDHQIIAAIFRFLDAKGLQLAR